jgi:hypothetical protein
MHSVTPTTLPNDGSRVKPLLTGIAYENPLCDVEPAG